MQIDLNSTDVLVLLRSLGYGECAISQAQLESGEAEVIESSTLRIRRRILRGLYLDGMNTLGIKNPQM